MIRICKAVSPVEVVAVYRGWVEVLQCVLPRLLLATTTAVLSSLASQPR